MLLDQRENVCQVVLAFAETAGRFFGGSELQDNQIFDSRKAKSEVVVCLNELGALDGIGNAHVLGGELDGGSEPHRLRAWRAPVVAVFVPTRMLESRAGQGRGGHVGVSPNGQIDVEGCSRFLGVKLNGYAANQGVAHSLALENLRDETQSRSLRIALS